MDKRLRQLAGQVITTGIPGPRLDGQTRRILERLAPSGVILFRRNVDSVEQLRRLTGELHALPSRPLISIDHEGGPVMRLGPPFTQFPAAASLGRGAAPDLTRAVGVAMGAELASVGIDINFAPVLDVDSNPRNPVIGERAFGHDPQRVAELSTAFLVGLRRGGTLPCGKHFPGHGDTDLDSHEELPVVTRSRDELDAVELPPFRAAIEHGVPMLMTAHVLYPALDEHRPATMSAEILRNLLRDELGFAGVVVSDDLEMRAVSAQAAVPEAALEALRAGVDWLLVCNDLNLSQRVADRIVAAAGAGELDEATLASAAARVLNLPPPPRLHPLALPVAQHEALRKRILELGRV